MVRPLVSALFMILTLVPSARALEFVPSRLLFTTRVEFPTRLSVCAGQLWAYERASGQLLALSLDSGKIRSRRSLDVLGPFRQITALACAGSNLVVAYDVSKNPVVSRIQPLLADDSRELTDVELPAVELKSRVQDLFCSGNDCYVLTENHLHVWQSVVPKSWQCVSDDCFYQSLTRTLDRSSGKLGQPVLKNVSVPALSSLRSLDVSTSNNPFAEWGFQTSQAQGRYIAGDVDRNGAMLLIDPFRTQIAKRADGSFGWWGRWGRWGYWGGRLFFPKEAVFMPQGTVAVLDGVLRTISLFSDAGKFHGLVAVKEQPPLLLWPSDLTNHGSRLYVSDSRANSVMAVELNLDEALNRRGKEKQSTAVSVSLFRRQGLIPDSDTDRCLHCHDGTLSDHAHHFKTGLATHPIEVKVKTKKPTLPLDAMGRVACKTCHDPHHGENFFEQGPPATRARPFLRESAPELCSQCHDNRERPNSHPMKAKVSCLNCHEVHGQVHGSLIRRTERLCLECHQPQKIQHRQVETVLDTGRASQLHFENGRISCATCHSAHQAKSAGLLNTRGFVMEFCSSCHGPRADDLYKNFHKLIKTKGTTWTP